MDSRGIPPSTSASRRRDARRDCPLPQTPRERSASLRSRFAGRTPGRRRTALLLCPRGAERATGASCFQARHYVPSDEAPRFTAKAPRTPRSEEILFFLLKKSWRVLAIL